MQYRKLLLILLGLSAFSAHAGERIVLIAHGGVGNPFWSVLFNGAKQAAKDLNVNLQILFPMKDGDQAGTTQKLSEAISTHPDGIAVTLATPANCEYIKEARKKQIPVVIFNARSHESGEGCPYQAYIGMDEYEAGRESGRRAWATGKIKGRVLIGLTEPGHAGHQARAKGIADELKKKNVKVDIVDVGTDSAAVPARIKGYLSNHQSDLSGIIVPAPIGMHPILRLMEEGNLGVGKIYASTFDLSPLILKAISEGLIDHTIDQQPYLQGYYSVSQLVLASRGKFTPVNMNTGAAIIEKSNVKAVSELVKAQIR
jgi:simple sugar transport system substrate-binding protein